MEYTNEEAYQQMLKDTDIKNRKLFVEHVNAFNTDKLSGPRFTIVFLDLHEHEDTLCIKQDEVFAFINTHMNSIEATALCLAEWTMKGECSGYNGKLYHKHELPEWSIPQLRQKGWIK